jgi:tetratricopeptide (TPR) repeat protein
MALASAHLAMGNLYKASISAENAIATGPDRLPPLLLRADIALQMDNPDKAKSCVEQVLQLQPDHPIALHQYAQALHQLGQIEQAMEVVKKAIPLAADPLPLLLEQTNLLESLHGNQANLSALQELATQYPDDPAVLAPLAKALAQNNEREEAIRTAQRALRGGSHALRSRDQAGLHYLLGSLLRQTGQLDQAIHQFSEAVRLAPDMLEAYLDLGDTQLERRQNALAIQTYQKAIQIAPEDPRPFYQAGLAFKASRDYPGAETMLRRAAELAPDDLAIHRQLAALVALNLVHSRRPVPMDA